MLSLGWIDFSQSDRNRVLEVLRQLKEPGAVDELGIGTIRDRFSDLLFPGTSTIQTRAKYFFLIPYICLELEREKVRTPAAFIAELEKREIDLIDILVVDGAEGVIGMRSGETLVRKPSHVYWNRLRIFGLLEKPVTAHEYARQVYQYKKDLNYLKSSIRKTESELSADDPIYLANGSTFWRVPYPKEDWRDHLTIDLTQEEASFLREKILSQKNTTDTLLALILRENRSDFIEYDEFSDMDALLDLMDETQREHYLLARNFSAFIFGAQIRYNVLFSDGQNEEANSLWEQYQEKVIQVNLDRIGEVLKPRTSVMRFLKEYQEVSTDVPRLDELIRRREIRLKGRSRSKLTNKELYRYDSRNINMRPLNYRLSYVQRIIQDVFEGEKQNV